MWPHIAINETLIILSVRAHGELTNETSFTKTFITVVWLITASAVQIAWGVTSETVPPCYSILRQLRTIRRSFEICSSVAGVVSRPRGWTTAIRHSPAFHHISCHGCSQWWTPPLGSSFPRRGSSTSLRSFVSCTSWRLQSGLHSNKQSSCTSVYTGPHLRTLLTSFVRWQMSRLVSDSVPVHLHHWLSATLHPTPYCRWPSFPGRRCTCLKQSAWSCHFRAFRSNLLVVA